MTDADYYDPDYPGNGPHIDTEGGEIPPETYQPPPALPAVRNEQPNRLPATAPQPAQQVTAAQAKVEAVAALTMHAYENASRLNPTEEEKKGILEPFEDACFRGGAAGKKELIYIEHAHLRSRLIKVFGPGNWSLITRSRWAEEFVSPNGQPGSRVYVEAMLIIRGCLAGEGIGSMEYYPKNAAVNYGDAVEGAKSQALRLCCKEFGIGLQAWDKSWCEAWWFRKKEAEMRARQQGQQQQQTQQAPAQQQKTNGEKTVPPIIPPPVHPEVAKWLPDIETLSTLDDFIRCGQAWNKIDDKLVRTEVWQHLCRAAHKKGVVFDKDARQFVQRSEPQPA